ncbi:MAG TPA: FecR domain-containing protein [Rhizomicrobium sp.]|nr:FecR domain-containing protein [Rhizomicrobium sp.]
MSIPSEEVQAEAASWLVKLQHSNRSQNEENGFRDWLAAHPMHATAFEAVSATWDITGGLPRDLRGRSLARPQHSRRAVMAGSAAALGVAGSFAFWQTSRAETYQTDVGEQKHISLDDGTRIFLDTDTRLSVRLGGEHRVSELHHGRVNFRVASDPSRPFVVNAAKNKVVAMPSNLDLRLDGERFSAVMIRGTADVIRAANQPERLEDGDRLIVDAGGLVRRDRPALTPLIAWQTGQMVFENGRLSEAAAEMNRYSNVKLMVADPEVADLRLSGIYVVGDNVTFANSVARLLPIRLVQGNGRIEIFPAHQKGG